MDSIHEERLRQLLVDELTGMFERGGLKIIGAVGTEKYDAPPRLKNEGYGDQEDKRPDVFAIDEKTGQFVIGIVRLGEQDLETEHALTQYNVFLDQFDPRTGERARLIVILPSHRVAEFNTLITHYLHPDLWEAISVVGSESISSES